MPSVARLAALGLLATVPHVASAADDECYNVKAELTPTDALQMVVWLESESGQYIDTLYITAKTGLYGLGNRPGRMDFNSGPIPKPGVDDMWPYGRRIGTFPVWAHRHGMTWPEIVFQDTITYNNDMYESNLSHSQGISSTEFNPPYCRPTAATPAAMTKCWPGGADMQIWETGQCVVIRDGVTQATTVYTDKGQFHPTRTSLYPPRADLTRQVPKDSADVEQYNAINPFDAVTRATPVGGDPLVVDWAVPPNTPQGNYVVWVEVSKEFDYNATYNQTTYPGPTLQQGYDECGLPYRGQPSVVYKVPITISSTFDTQMTTEYVGYGDVNGGTGTLHPPDATITTDTPGSGALRLQLVSDNGQMFRLRVTAAKRPDYGPPGTPSELVPRTIGPNKVSLDFIESGDDGQVGAVTRYEVRTLANGEITEDNFNEATLTLVNVVPGEPGHLATLELEGLLPETEYSVAVRAYDDCFKQSPIVVTHFTTGEREFGSVDACFIATAAYGSAMANEVSVLRSFRDATLSKSILGELAVEAYYTFGPAMAGVIGESDMLRATARAALRPVIDRVSALGH